QRRAARRTIHCGQALATGLRTLLGHTYLALRPKACAINEGPPIIRHCRLGSAPTDWPPHRCHRQRRFSTAPAWWANRYRIGHPLDELSRVQLEWIAPIKPTLRTSEQRQFVDRLASIALWLS